MYGGWLCVFEVEKYFALSWRLIKNVNGEEWWQLASLSTGGPDHRSVGVQNSGWPIWNTRRVDTGAMRQGGADVASAIRK